MAVLRPAAHDLLQADDIGVGHRVGDAGHVVLAVGADAVVDVVGAEEHPGLPWRFSLGTATKLEPQGHQKIVGNHPRLLGDVDWFRQGHSHGD